jgi:hypothetical protein
MPVHNNRSQTYIHTKEQENKNDSISTSKKLVKDIQKIFLENQEILSCEEYEPDDSLRINGAPAIKLPNGKLVIAPDLKCKMIDGTIFWIEVKDKCQRFFKPDTGADLHQVLGFYQINKLLKEPVLMVFKDASFNECSVSGENISDELKLKYKNRWNLFKGLPYANWLNNCLSIDNLNKYPMINEEKSRNISMYIFYFHINSFKLLDVKEVLEEKIIDIQDLCAYNKTKLLDNFSDIEKLSIGYKQDTDNICSSCKQYFKPKFQGAKLCFECWKKASGI